MAPVALGLGVAKKWFGSRREEADDDVQGDHPVVRAVFAAVNTGDFDQLSSVVDGDCRLYVNAFEISRGDLDRGPALMEDGLRDLRDALPDIRWELYDELSGTDEGKDKIAIRFASHSTVDGESTEYPVACFGILDDDRLVEWRQVADLDWYNQRRRQSGEEALGSSSDPAD